MLWAVFQIIRIFQLWLKTLYSEFRLQKKIKNYIQYTCFICLTLWLIYIYHPFKYNINSHLAISRWISISWLYKSIFIIYKRVFCLKFTLYITGNVPKNWLFFHLYKNYLHSYLFIFFKKFIIKLFVLCFNQLCTSNIHYYHNFITVCFLNLFLIVYNMFNLWFQDSK